MESYQLSSQEFPKKPLKKSFWIILFITFLGWMVLALFVPRALTFQGVASYREGDDNTAIGYYNIATWISPKYKYAYFNRALSYIRQEKYELAISDFNKAIDLDPTYPPSYYLRGKSYISIEKYDLAIADFSKVIEIDPDYERVYFYRGSAYVLSGKNELAIIDLTKAIKDDDSKADVFFWLGSAYANSQQFPKAISFYKKAITLSQESYTYCVLGVIYTKIGDFSSAIPSFEEGIKLDGKGELSWCRTALENAVQGIPTP